MNQFEFHGKIAKITKVQEINDTMKKKTVILVEAEGDYPKSIGLDFWNDKIEQLDSLKVGEKVIGYYNPKAREGKDGKVYNSINGRRIQPVQVSDKGLVEDDSGEDLPF